jgi:hypothetical protein
MIWVKEALYIFILMCLPAIIAAKAVVWQFTSEHYIVIMPKSDVKKLIPDEQGDRAVREYNRKKQK